ncbi:hypothetical protein ACWDE9_47415, partial [Streptomyces olivaceoviridis]
MRAVRLRRARAGGTALLAALTVLTALSSGPASADSTRPPKIPGPLGHAAPATAYCDIPAERDIAVTRKVYEVGQRMNVSPKVMLAGFETGWVESRMNNLACGDRDSLGVFQQRPSQGWGSPEQVLDVDYAASKFFEVAEQMEPGMEGSTAGQLAQAVQRSAYPLRYDQAEDTAVALRDEAFQPYGTIGAKYGGMGGPGSVLGAPVRAEEAASLGGRF